MTDANQTIIDDCWTVAADQRHPPAAAAIRALIALAERLQAQVDGHAEAVEAAYREGWIDGCAEYDPEDRVRDWNASDAKAALEGKP